VSNKCFLGAKFSIQHMTHRSNALQCSSVSLCVFTTNSEQWTQRYRHQKQKWNGYSDSCTLTFFVWAYFWAFRLALHIDVWSDRLSCAAVSSRSPSVCRLGRPRYLEGVPDTGSTVWVGSSIQRTYSTFIWNISFNTESWRESRQFTMTINYSAHSENP